jgi:hypothetical protein
MDRCQTHTHDSASGVCRTCHGEFCETCLVYSYGRGKPPYCIRCALIAAGTTPSPAWLAEFAVSA